MDDIVSFEMPSDVELVYCAGQPVQKIRKDAFIQKRSLTHMVQTDRSAYWYLKILEVWLRKRRFGSNNLKGKGGVDVMSAESFHVCLCSAPGIANIVNKMSDGIHKLASGYAVIATLAKPWNIISNVPLAKSLIGVASPNHLKVLRSQRSEVYRSGIGNRPAWDY